MIQTIAILALIGVIFSILNNCKKGNVEVDFFLALIAVLAWWKIELLIAVLIIILILIVNLAGAKQKNSGW